jgi:deazaflavin-dependent oxidoreductase (nitroreductase family)
MMTTPHTMPRRASPLLKLFMRLRVALYRRTDGRIGGRLGSLPVLLLTTTGRKTGQPHTIPLAYFEDDDDLFVVASNAGRNWPPAWYVNLVAHPQIEIEIRHSHRTVLATTATPAERARLWKQLVFVAPIYARYERSSREIPIVILHTAPLRSDVSTHHQSAHQTLPPWLSHSR